MGSVASGIFGFLQNIRPQAARYAKDAGLVAADLDAWPLYREGDILGAALAYISLVPAFHLFFRGALLYHERSWFQLEMWSGVGCNAVLSKLLKRLVRIERPAATCEQLGLCGDLGMPSTHSQIMAFAWVTMLLQMRAGEHRRRPSKSQVDTLEFVCLTALVAAVAWSRVYLGYHDLSQVCAGLSAGAATAVVWRFAVTRGWVRRPLQHIVDCLGLAEGHMHAE